MNSHSTTKSLMRILLLLPLIFIFSCQTKELAATSPSSLPSSLPQTINAKEYQYAYAHRDCAPWDGSAVRITLSDKPYNADKPNKPNLSICIYKNVNNIAGQTFILGQDDRTGSANLFTTDEKYIPAKSGKVQITKIEPDKSISGEYDLEMENGIHHKGSFQASWIDLRILCG